MHSLAILSLFAFCAISMAIPMQTNPDQALKNVSSAAASTQMDAHTLRLDDAAQSAEKAKAAAKEAEKKKVISREDAAEITKAADNVQRAAAIGDHEAVKEHAEKLHDHVEDAVAAKKGPEVAEKLKKADANIDKPVLSTPEDEKLLREAVAEVIAADKQIPPEKKAEATNYTVNAMKQGFRAANTTNGQLVTAVETQAALNKTATDRDDEREHWRRCCEGHEFEHRGCEGWDRRRCEEWERGHRRQRQAYPSSYGSPSEASPSEASSAYASPSYASPSQGSPAYASPALGSPAQGSPDYGMAPQGSPDYGMAPQGGAPDGNFGDPAFSYGYGYRQCLLWSPFSYCRRRLFGDWAFHRGFHHFFRNHGRGGRGGRGGGRRGR